MRNNIAKICNFKQQPQRREYLLFQKHIFLKFENTRWQIKAIVVSDKNRARKRYMKVTIL